MTTWKLLEHSRRFMGHNLDQTKCNTVPHVIECKQTNKQTNKWKTTVEGYSLSKTIDDDDRDIHPT